VALARVSIALAIAIFSALASSGSGAPSGGAVTFTDIGTAAGLMVPSTYGGVDRKRFIIETNGAGTAWIDADDDGWLDALVLGGSRLLEGQRAEDPAVAAAGPTTRLYRNQHDGTFKDITATSGLGLTVWASSVCGGDYDNDGRLDLLITSFGRNRLFRSVGGARFDDVTAALGLPVEGPPRWGSGCSFLDFDRDGRLDLFVSNYLLFELATATEPGQGVNCLWKGIPVNCGPKGLPTDTNVLYRNTGSGFVDVSVPSGIARVTRRYSMTALAADFDEDGWTDIYVASDSTAAILYRNNHDGTFTDVAVPSGAALSENGMAQAGMGAATGDINGDGRLDLFKTHFADDIPALYRASGKGMFEDIATAAGLAVQNRYVEWGAGIVDVDNDGWQDLLYMTGNVYPEVEQKFPRYPHKGPRVLFRNNGDGTFADVSASAGSGLTTPHSSRGAAFGDFDNDGDIDVLAMNMNEPPSLLRNDTPKVNHWVAIALEGKASNRAGIGATIRVTVGGRVQARAVLSQSSYYSMDDLRAHFGVGEAARVERIEVVWPSGQVDVVTNVAADRFVTLVEGSGRVVERPAVTERPPRR
jgi:enediyne biosynthesis protein E4